MDLWLARKWMNMDRFMEATVQVSPSRLSPSFPIAIVAMWDWRAESDVAKQYVVATSDLRVKRVKLRSLENHIHHLHSYSYGKKLANPKQDVSQEIKGIGGCAERFSGRCGFSQEFRWFNAHISAGTSSSPQ